jgi:hypothetical protein
MFVNLVAHFLEMVEAPDPVEAYRRHLVEHPLVLRVGGVSAGQRLVGRRIMPERADAAYQHLAGALADEDVQTA